MKVAVLYATDFASISPGGIQNFITRVGRFAPPDMDITYIGLGEPRSLPRPGDNFLSVGDAGRGSVNGAFLRGLSRVRQSFSGEYDLLVAHRAEHVLALPARVPTALTLHGGSWNALHANNRLFGLAYPAIEATACRLASSVLSVDASGHTWLARKLAGTILPIATPASETFRTATSPPARDDLLLTASRLVPEKRIDRLIRLAAEGRRRLVIFGDGPSRAQLERLAQEVDADVDFRGTVDSNQLAAEYREGGIFCLSSAFEGYPLAAVEAATSGLPVVGVESSAVSQLEFLGAVSTSSVAEALEVIENGRAGAIAPERAWRAHSPESVAAAFWDHVRRPG